MQTHCTNDHMTEFATKFFLLPLNQIPVLLVLVSMLIWASYTDIKVNKVYNKMCMVYLVMRLAMAPLYPISLQTLIGGVVGLGLLLAPAVFLNTSHMAGDIKFAGVLGLWIGPFPVMMALFTASILLIITSIILKKGKTGVLPFAPFISLGCVILTGVQYYLLYLSH